MMSRSQSLPSKVCLPVRHILFFPPGRLFGLAKKNISHSLLYQNLREILRRLKKKKKRDVSFESKHEDRGGRREGGGRDLHSNLPCLYLTLDPNTMDVDNRHPHPGQHLSQSPLLILKTTAAVVPPPLLLGRGRRNGRNRTCCLLTPKFFTTMYYFFFPVSDGSLQSCQILVAIK